MSIEEVHNNTRAILEGTLDRTIVQNHELPFYDALRNTTNEVLETIPEEYMEKEFHEYWAKIKEQIMYDNFSSSSISATLYLRGPIYTHIILN